MGFKEFLAEVQLRYPSDCNARAIARGLSGSSCVVEPGGKHLKVKDRIGNTVVALPHDVKSNFTCKDIVKRLNLSC